MMIGPCSLDMPILNNYWRFSINGASGNDPLDDFGVDEIRNV